MRKLLAYVLSLSALHTWVLAEEDEPRLDAPGDSPQPEQPVVPETPREAPEQVPEAVKKEGETRYGQITVIGSRQVVRGGIASMVEAVRVDMNKLVSQAGRKLKIPLTIRLYGKAGDEELKQSIVSKITNIAGEYQLSLHVHLAKGVDVKRLRYHVMELLLYERGLGEGQEISSDERVLVPPWLIIGMLESLDIRAGKADKSIYQAQLPYFEILPLEKALSASESQWRAMEGRQPLAFRAISGALVSALLRQPDGRPSMAQYLAAVATHKGEMENLMRQHFPSMNSSKNSLTKWVDLEMAELGTKQTSDAFSILETEERLESILKLRYNDENKVAVTVGMDGYQKILELEPPERITAVAGARAELERLSYRCFPVYRPLLAEYEMILREVIVGKDKGIETRLKNLQDSRKTYHSVGVRVRDYLDWYYINQSNEVSGDFKAYMDLCKALEEEKGQPNSDIAVGTYLDKVEEIFSGSSR